MNVTPHTLPAGDHDEEWWFDNEAAEPRPHVVVHRRERDWAAVELVWDCDVELNASACKRIEALLHNHAGPNALYFAGEDLAGSSMVPTADIPTVAAALIAIASDPSSWRYPAGDDAVWSDPGPGSLPEVTNLADIVARAQQRTEYVDALIEAAGGDESMTWGEAAARLAEGTNPDQRKGHPQ